MNNEINKCYHCGLEVAPFSHFRIKIFDQNRSLCCAGCLAIANAIVKNNLTQFYSQRTEISQLSYFDSHSIISKIKLYDKSILHSRYVKQQGNYNESVIMIHGIVCPACVWLLERHISSLPGIIEFRINYSTHRARIVWNHQDIKISQILNAILDIGYRGFPYDPSEQQKLVEQQHKKALWRIAIAAVAMIQVMMFAIAMYAADSGSSMDDELKNLMRWVSLLFTAPVVLFSSQTFILSAYRHVKQFKLSMDVPVSIAILMAFSASVWATISHHGEIYYDSVTMFTFFLLSGRYLEMRARHKAGYVAEQLLRLLPSVVRLIKKNQVEIIALENLKVADRVLVKAGETIPADGIIESGQSFVDESLITGESREIKKGIESSVIAGSINTKSPLTVKVEKVAADTVLAGISRLLERALLEKPEIAKLADYIASWFVLALLVTTFGIALAWWFYDISRVFEITISLLVVTCPCALSLATPTAMAAITGKLTRHGVLTTRSDAIEVMSKLSHVVFDKTGTLTHGQPKVINFTPYNNCSHDTILGIAATLAQYSEHPLAREIHQYYKKHTDYSQHHVVKNYVGSGISVFIDNTEYLLGSAMFIQQQFKIDSFNLNPELNSVVFLASENQLMARFNFEDVLRDDALATVALLQKLNIKTILLSGDDFDVVKKIAAPFNFDSVHGNCRPEDKLNLIQVLQKNNAVIAMIGDGINDAPVLNAAQVSIAMASATQLAQASASMILLSNKLIHIPFIIKQSLQSMKIIKQNLAWAVVYNIIAIPLAALGVLSPWMAALGMSLSSLLVVANALRLTVESDDDIKNQ